MANVIELHSLDAPELAVFARLTDRQLRSRAEPEQGVLIAESPKVIAAALVAGNQPVAQRDPIRAGGPRGAAWRAAPRRCWTGWAMCRYTPATGRCWPG